MAPESSEAFGDRSDCADALREPIQPLCQAFLLGAEAHSELPDLGRPERCSIRGEFIIVVNPLSAIFHSIPAAEHFSATIF
jgi:hypothetical protein